MFSKTSLSQTRSANKQQHWMRYYQANKASKKHDNYYMHIIISSKSITYAKQNLWFSNPTPHYKTLIQYRRSWTWETLTLTYRKYTASMFIKHNNIPNETNHVEFTSIMSITLGPEHLQYRQNRTKWKTEMFLLLIYWFYNGTCLNT